MTKEDETLYQLLKVKTSASQKEVKLAYYKMAKLHHPDFQKSALTEKQKQLSEDHFKLIVKAYEVLSNPIQRQAYDIENRINEGVNLDSHTFEDSTSKKNYFQPRTQTDFYHTKWTDYKKPDWYHPLNGLDGRSEYLYRKTVNSWIPPVVEIVILKLEGYRLYIYMLLFGLWNVYEAYKAYR